SFDRSSHLRDAARSSHGPRVSRPNCTTRLSHQDAHHRHDVARCRRVHQGGSDATLPCPLERGTRSEIAKQTLQMDVLRWKKPELVRKELWTHILAYNLIRTIMAQAANKHG